MTQDNKIWHKPNEKLPTDKWSVVFIVPNASPRVGHFWICADVFKDFYTDDGYASNVVNQWAYLDDLVASSKALEKLDAEYNEFICNTWVDYADEPDENLASDARMLRDRMRKVMSSQILKERDNYKKALDVAIDALKDIQWFCYAPTMGERARYMQQCADKTLKQVNEIMKSLQ